MKFEQLIIAIELTSRGLQKRALTSVNKHLVIRNWLIGFYIFEFEQKGEDRAKYGTKLLDNISKEMKKKKLKGISKTNLKLFRQLYETYPQLSEVIIGHEALKLDNTVISGYFIIGQNDSDQFKSTKKSLPAKDYYTAPVELLENFTFSHFVELIKVKDPLHRAFYEKEAIKGVWGMEFLKKQIGNLLLERLALSKDKDALLKMVEENNKPETIEDTIKNPYILDFTEFKDLPVYTETELESSILNKIQDFLVELGNGFCFEARQKRININGEFYRIDLVFYHRILKCHVLIDLKVRPFSHEDVGQMNFYLNYYKKNMMTDGDNSPVGIILCTEKDNVKVEYATAGIDNKMFVSKYLIELPSEEELRHLLTE